MMIYARNELNQKQEKVTMLHYALSAKELK